MMTHSYLPSILWAVQIEKGALFLPLHSAFAHGLRPPGRRELRTRWLDGSDDPPDASSELNLWMSVRLASEVEKPTTGLHFLGWKITDGAY